VGAYGMAHFLPIASALSTSRHQVACAPMAVFASNLKKEKIVPIFATPSQKRMA
jgi:hypothetical protein